MEARNGLVAVVWSLAWSAAGAVGAAPVSPDPEILRLQLILDAAHFSPGEIDGRRGPNTRAALAALRAVHCRDAEAEAAALVDARPLIVPYTITEEDAAGPFVPIPEDMMEKAELDALGYSSLVEALAERFHSSPRLLLQLNEPTAFVAGAEIRVPNVQRPPPPRAAQIVVDESDGAVLLKDGAGCVLARYPATMGSENDPLPVGRWKVVEKQENPVFRYNPELFWDADPAHSKARLAPGPNSPVGLVWIGLSKPHYGIHGTSEPSRIAKTQSHGCIRLTNWDALEAAGAVAIGTPAILQE